MTVTAHVAIMLSLKISSGLSKLYATGRHNSIAQDKTFSPQHSQADIAKKKVSQISTSASPPRPKIQVLHGQNSDIMNKLRRKDHPSPPPLPPTLISTYMREVGSITIGYDPHFPPPPSSILPVLNQEQNCPITPESRRGVNLNKVDTRSSERDNNKVRQTLLIQIQIGVIL